MSLKGLKLGALYSYKCPRSEELGFNQALLEFIKNGTEPEKVKKYLESLLSHAYYRIIASQNNIKDIFDPRVVQAYWTGNELTRVIKGDDSALLPFHNFTALEAIFRKLNPDPDNCKVSVALIKRIEEERIFIDHRPLIRKGNKFFWVNELEEREIEKGFVSNIEIGKWITYHWGIARENISEKDAAEIINRTKQATELFNENSSRLEQRRRAEREFIKKRFS